MVEYNEQGFAMSSTDTPGLTFGGAVEQLKQGARVLRQGWNGKQMFLELVEPRGAMLPFITMKTADDKLVPWLASQSDVLAEDWEVLEPPAQVG